MSRINHCSQAGRLESSGAMAATRMVFAAG